MDTEKTVEGECFCGSVRVTAQPKTNQFGACHCAICSQWGGGPLLAVECEDRASFEGDSHIGVYASFDWAERGFFKQCGTQQFYRLIEQPFYAVPIGMFGEGQSWELASQIFIDHKPSYYSFANPTKNLTGAEVFAQFTDDTQ